jgi:hypothetical protein
VQELPTAPVPAGRAQLQSRCGKRYYDVVELVPLFLSHRFAPGECARQLCWCIL